MSPELERVIGKAVVDQAFREALLDNPKKAVDDAGISLSKDDEKTLKDGIKELNKKVKKKDELDTIFAAARGGWWG